MQKEPESQTLILASASPRRQLLLRRAGIPVRVVPAGVDESMYPPGSLDPPGILNHAEHLARLKAEAVSARHPDHWVLGADTMVVTGGASLGKPGDEAGARDMLSRLSGAVHEVVTGFHLCHHNLGRAHSDRCVTRVRFKKLTPEDVDWYVATGKPFDKAGGYGIQGEGAFLVREIEGSYTNVVGLPVSQVVEMLEREQALVRHHGNPAAD